MAASTIDAAMTDLEIQDFITRFAAAWASRDGEAFLALRHPDGVLHSPLYDRPVLGKELGRRVAFAVPVFFAVSAAIGCAAALRLNALSGSRSGPR